MRIVYIICVFLLLLFTETYGAVGPPSLRCISVSSGGDVTLTWIQPPDPLNEFSSYAIYYSASLAGPYTQVGSLPSITQQTFTHTGAAAGISSRYYYIVTLYGPSNSASAPSDTLRSIKLTVGSPAISIASLSWNSIHIPPLPSTSTQYYIYNKPVSTWILLDSTTGLSYLDTVYRICDTTQVPYKVEIRDNSGCISTSSEAAGNFRDDQPPPLTQLKSVSVDVTTNRPVVSWYPNRARDVQGYYIFSGAGPAQVGTSPSSTSSFTDNAFDASAQIASYTVAAYDYCLAPNGFPQGGPYENQHRSILLRARLNICAGQIELLWNRYESWKTGVSAYEVFASVNGGPYTSVGLPGSTAASFIHTGLSPGSTYRYYVMATDGSSQLFSTSNHSEDIVFQTSSIPSNLSIESVTVDRDRQKNVITWSSDTSAFLTGYRILRSVHNLTFDTIAFVPNERRILFTYEDNTAVPSQSAYYYKVIAVDSCQHLSKTSNTARTMLLRTSSLGEFSNNLVWNDYEDWTGTLALHRSINGQWEQAPVVTLPYGTNTYTDDISAYLSSDGIFCYYVEAVRTGSTASSLSNVECVRKEAKVYVPNAFMPESEIEANRTFKPVNVYIDSRDYNLSIYNRVGVKVFETGDPNRGWDGQYSGEPQPIGIYAYIIRFRAADGSTFVKTGSITLLR
jgi:hypothetical protein